MRRLIIPLTLLSLAAQAGAPDCTALSNIISDMETDLQRSSLPNCKKVNIKDAVKEGEIVDPNITIEFENARCFALGTLESEISKMEGQLATIRGLQEFSKDLSKKNDLLKNVVTSEALKKNIVVQAKNFQKGLKTAFVMEKLLAFKTNDFLMQLKERTATGDLTKRDLTEVLSKSCPGKDYCEALNDVVGYLSDEAVLKDIGTVLKDSPLDPKSIEAMKTAITIVENDGKQTPTSYEKIMDTLDENKVDLSKVTATNDLDKNLIKALKSVPSFTPNGNLSFLKELSDSKNALETKSIIDTFKYLNKDVSTRNELTIKSKLSAVINSYSNGKQMPAEAVTKCEKLFDPAVSSDECLKALESFDPGNSYENEKETLLSLRSLSDSNKKLNERAAQCMNEQILINNTQLSSGPNTLKDCDITFIEKEADLAKKLSAYNLVRSKLLSEKKRNQDFRNYAIERLNKNTCKVDNAISEISNCGGINLTNINPALNVLTGDILKVAVIYQAEPEVDISGYCDSEDKKTDSESRICEFEEEDAKEPVFIANADNTTAPTDIEDDRAGHDAKMNALSGAMNNIFGALGNANRTQAYNPYNYNNPYSTYSPMTISDSLTYSSVYYGGYSGYYPMANSSPFVYNSQLLGYTNKGTGTGSNYSYSAAGGSTSSYGVSSFIPTFGF